MVRDDLHGLRLEIGQKARERVLFLKMYTDMLEEKDIARWLEQQVQKVLFMDRVLDCWKIWTGEGELH